MEPLTSTGVLAHATGLSEKAVRLYADRGLLHAVRDPRSGARGFAPDQVERARRIALLRGLDLPLAEVADVLDAADPVAVFDAVWSARRDETGRHAAAAERLRAVLGGGAHAPADLLLCAPVPEPVRPPAGTLL